MNNSYEVIVKELTAKKVRLVAVSKTRSNTEIMDLYDRGQRDFGENRVQELLGKYEALPKDIRWHLIGHLQRNKVKYLSSFIDSIQSIDSLSLLELVNDSAKKHDRKINIHLQVKIAQEEQKYGLSAKECQEIAEMMVGKDRFKHVRLTGLMGMASYTNDEDQVREEFRVLSDLFVELRSSWMRDSGHFELLSMGMSGDYQIAMEEGANMVRIGSLLFD